MPASVDVWARESTWHEAAIPQMIGDKAETLYQHPFFSKFSEEISQSRMQIIKQWPNQSQRSIINAMGKPISKKEDDRFIMAHIQQGLEARMLHIAIEYYGDQIVLLQHDGFSTLTKIDCNPIILQIANELNLAMQITSNMHRIQWIGRNKQDRKNTRQVLTNTKSRKNLCKPIHTRSSEISRFQSEFF